MGPARFLVGAMNDAYKIGFQVKDLMLLVAFAQMSGTEFVTAAAVHVPLNQKKYVFPSSHHSSSLAAMTLTDFHFFCFFF